jgi:hypothetical protein
MRRRLYRYRYLIFAATAVAMVSLILSGYVARTSTIDLATGGVASWPYYGGDQEGTRYVPLDQINRENVAYLKVAWEYRTGDFSDGSDGRPETTFQATPILVDGILYLATVYGRVIALNPETGAEIWKYDPGLDTTVERGEFATRGVTYWRAAAERARSGACERRIFVATVDARLIALNAAAGTLCADFGRAGQVDLSRGVNLGEYQVDTHEYGSHRRRSRLAAWLSSALQLALIAPPHRNGASYEPSTRVPENCVGFGILSRAVQPTRPSEPGRAGVRNALAQQTSGHNCQSTPIVTLFSYLPVVQVRIITAASARAVIPMPTLSSLCVGPPVNWCGIFRSFTTTFGITTYRRSPV